MDPLTIWINQPFPDDVKAHLVESAAPHRMTFSGKTTASNLLPGTPDADAHAADVMFGQPDPADILAAPDVRWVQLTSAGYTRYDDLAFLKTLRDRGIAFCNASGVFDEPCAQHVTAFLLSLARSLPKGLFGRPQFAKLPAEAIYVSIGRGDTTDQDALMAALQDGRLAHAFLDVTTPEPLPPDHPLWRTPNCHITPHTAGGTIDEPVRLAEHFLDNLRRFVRGEAMLDRIV